MKLKIDISYETWECGDGCCSSSAYICRLNDEELGTFSSEVECLEAILEKLGYEFDYQLRYED